MFELGVVPYTAISLVPNIKPGQRGGSIQSACVRLDIHAADKEAGTLPAAAETFNAARR